MPQRLFRIRPGSLRLFGVLVLLPGLLTAGGVCALAPAPLPSAVAEQRTADYFARVRSDESRLVPFLRQMPKGADLHNHASGAIYAESYVRWAAADGLCVDLQALAVLGGTCDAAAGKPELKAALQKDGGSTRSVVMSWIGGTALPRCENCHGSQATTSATTTATSSAGTCRCRHRGHASASNAHTAPATPR